MAMYNTSFTINLADLSFMLRQIKIAEASSMAYTTAPLSILDAIMAEYGMTAEAASLSPFGLRTVDGTFNNLLPGQTNYGAADTLFPRMTDPVFINEADGDTMPLGPLGSGAPTIINTDYGTAGSVADADPRIISNLIVDMSLSNPAAIEAFLSNPLSREAFVGLTGLPEGDAAAWLVDPANVVLATELMKTIPNQSPDIGLSPGFNSWMTFFGQFFDHGLDLVTKGNAGTVYIPLQPDDPLYVENSPTNFMALTRATPTIIDGVAQHENTTTGWIDQNQTYTSHSSHQVFLREYVKDINGVAISTGRLLDGSAATGSLSGSIGNWADVKAQALDMFGIILNDFDIHNVPLLVTDQYGKFIPGANGYAQLVMAPDAEHLTNWIQVGTAVGITTAGSIGTNHAFLNDIAHHAAPSFVDDDHNPATAKIQQVADSDNVLGDDNNALTYDDEMLNSHFMTGDGRGNENIGLTSVHSIFHSEHNRAVEVNKATILASGDLAFINEWLVNEITEIPSDTTTLVWDGDRLFQAARFSTEMQYQHMVFEEFARRMQPMVDPFIFTNTADINPSIVAEFAHTVYRFGHSMLTGTVDRLENDLTTVNGEASQASLLAAFLNPQMYIASGQTAEEANANLIRGLSRDMGNEIDEFIVSDVRSTLLGLPLDLAALNIARGRETGIPSLNETRAQLYAGGAIDLKPYVSWVDFSEHIKNPLSIINFIAAYGTHASIVAATTTEGMRQAAEDLVNLALGGEADAVAFLNATGAYAGGDLGGMNNIDLWIGGLAEAKNEFGGMLGQTFNFIFEYQMESLQDGDRMYYLSRTQGTNLLNQLEPNTFSDMVMRNTDLGDIYSTHLNGFLFVTPDHTFELDRGIAQTDYNGTDAGLDPTWAAGEPHSLLQNKVVRSYTSASTLLDTETGITHDVGGYFKFLGGEHVVVGGTEGVDRIYTDKGIDTLWGDGGNDYLNAGTESDNVFGGDGDDIIEDPFGDDMLRGNAGNDVIASARGFDILFGDAGNDFIMLGQDFSEVFAGTGDDFVLGGTGSDALLGNEGNDWIEGGEGFDGLAGENSELFFDSPIIGHDVLNGQGNDTDYDGESGDDIMVQGAGIQRSNGMFGFDWAIHKGDAFAADSDLGIPFFPAQVAFTLRDRFDSVEGLSGWDLNDVLTGAAVLKGAAGGAGAGPGNPVNESHLLSQNVGLIDGYAALLGYDTPLELQGLAGMTAGTTVFDTTLGAEIIIGGGGSDTIRGNLGNDILDGDAWLNVRIRVLNAVGAENTLANELFSVDSLTEIQARLLSGEINPGQLAIVREILQSTTATTDVDTAVYNGNLSEYTIVNNADGSFTVTHTPVVVGGGGGALVDDGIDTIRNFERLQFAGGQTIVIQGSNAVGTGDVFINDPSPFEDNQLTTGGTFFDADGFDLASIVYTWEAQVNPTQWVAVGTGEGFVPGDAEVGLALRVRATFLDNLGVTETVFSAATNAVQNLNDLPLGLPVITGSATENQTLSASTIGITDADGLGAFSYQWTRGGVAIAGSTNQTLILGDADVGTSIAVVVSYTDLHGTPEVLTSVATLPVANVNDAPTGVATAALAAGTEDVAYVVSAANLLAGFSDIDVGNVLSVSGLTASSGTVTANLNGTYTITQAANVNGLVSLSYNVIDGLGGSIAASQNFTLAAVNDAPTGLVAINNLTPSLTQTLTTSSTLADVDGMPNPVGYQWQSSADGTTWSDIAGATAATFTPVAAQQGLQLHVRASFVDGGGTTESVFSDATAAVAAAIAFNVITGTNGSDLLIGTALSDRIFGLNGDDIIIGGAGADDMIGGAGNDTYEVTDVGDVVTEAVSAGTDTVWTSLASYTLTDNVENLRLGGTGSFIGTGNELANLIIGGAGADTINGAGGNDAIIGGAGADTMVGGLGNDIYEVTDAGDEVIEAASEGIDTVWTSLASYALTDNVENLNLGGTGSFTGTGNSLDNTIVGGSLSDVLIGGAGADTMVGGLGNDVYEVTDVGDVVQENSSAGTDTVWTSLASYTLTDNVENLMLGGTGSFAGTGNGLNNTIVGGSGTDTLDGGAGNDVLIGGAGADAMVGGLGNDVYEVTDVGDVVTEAVNAGTDTVWTSLASYTLTDNVENLMLGGTGSFAGTGNDLNNTIVGGSLSDVLIGGAGNDTIVAGGGTDTITGGAGQDTLTGGTGKDAFVIAATADTGTTAETRDIITDFATVIAATLANSDLINVNAIDANTVTVGDQAFAFIGIADFTAAGQIRYVQAGGNTFIEGNVDAGLGADFSIQLSGLHVLGETDFVL